MKKPHEELSRIKNEKRKLDRLNTVIDIAIVVISVIISGFIITMLCL